MTSVFERLYLPNYFSLKYLREFTKMITSNCRVLGSYYFIHDIKVFFVPKVISDEIKVIK